MFDCKCERCTEGIGKPGGLGDDDAKLVAGADGLKEAWLERDLGEANFLRDPRDARRCLFGKHPCALFPRKTPLRIVSENTLAHCFIGRG